jgi:hypothetical protein
VPRSFTPAFNTSKVSTIPLKPFTAGIDVRLPPRKATAGFPSTALKSPIHTTGSSPGFIFTNLSAMSLTPFSRDGWLL